MFALGVLPFRSWGQESVQDLDAEELVERLRATVPPEDVRVRGTIRYRDEDNRRFRAPFEYEIAVGEDRWWSTYLSEASGPISAQRLIVERQIDGPTRYRIQTMGEIQADGPVWLSGEQAMQPFAGSDFWWADLGMEFLNWPEHWIDRATKIKMRKGRACKVLESRNPAASGKGYSRVRAWIDNETGGVIIAEAYDGAGKIWKEFEVGGVTKVNGRWELKDMEMRDVRKDSRTILEFSYHRDP